MKQFFIISLLSVLLLNYSGVIAQITPKEANKAMARGINIGNTMEPENEGGWNNGPVKEYYFDDYKAAGFTSIRIPIRWDKHTGATSPYKINDAWLNRVEQVIDWGLKRDLFIVINAHHEDWIKTGYDNKNLRDRFDSIWSQIATRFQNKSEKLLFEIINEPNGLTQANINDLNARVLSIIRRTNPTRIVLFSGNMYANSDQLIAAAVPNDPYLIGYYHSYDPWSFAGEATGTWGTSSDRQAMASKYAQVAQWSAKHNVPVTINEFGAQRKCDYNSRMYHYASDVEEALKNNIAFNAWEDGGDFLIYNRSARTWNEIKDILIYTSDSSITQLKITQIEDKLNLSWLSRSKTIDSISIERKNNAGEFQSIAVIPGNAASYLDNCPETYKTYYYRVVAKYSNGAKIPSYPISGLKIATVRSPFLGAPVSIPGVIQAENFDEGGELLTFHDVDFVNTPGKYRTNVGVDIESRDDGGYQITNIAAGEWLEYTINVTETAEYTIDTWVSSVEGGGKFSYLIGKVGVASEMVPKTGSTQTLAKTTSVKTLNAGEQIMRLKLISTPAFAIDRIEITKKTTGVDRINNNSLCSVFSNAPNTLSFEGFNNGSDARISVFNTLGVKFYESPIREGTNNITLPENGIYLYQIVTAKGLQQTGKVQVK